MDLVPHQQSFALLRSHTHQNFEFSDQVSMVNMLHTVRCHRDSPLCVSDLLKLCFSTAVNAFMNLWNVWRNASSFPTQAKYTHTMHYWSENYVKTTLRSTHRWHWHSFHCTYRHFTMCWIFSSLLKISVNKQSWIRKSLGIKITIACGIGMNLKYNSEDDWSANKKWTSP